MNINKKLDRVKQWAGEKMGAESRTGVSEEFRALETEMDLRHAGAEEIHKSMTAYMKSMSKRNEIGDREKVLPVAYLAQTMTHHGEDFEPDSTFGNCLIGMGRTNDRVARLQESYVQDATHGWLESLERSLATMKEYQAARKKLENRRLAYDASLSKMQKAKKEDFRAEEELRSQKAKYEESSEDVLRRMEDIKEAEAESVSDLGAFLDAELEYFDKCRDELLRLKRDWPAGTSSPDRSQRRPAPRSRSNTVHSYKDRLAEEEPEPEPVRPSIRSTARVPSSSTRLETRLEHVYTNEDSYIDSPSSYSRRSSVTRPPMNSRASTFQGPTSIYRESPISATVSRQNSNFGVSDARGNLRPVQRIDTRERGDVFGDPSDDSTLNSASPDRSYGARSISPATSHGSGDMINRSGNVRKAPPPPPSRAKKPPPPLPMKRADMSSQSVNRY
ncbi:hypothetical protein BJ878DRAFT_299927 [Calycina marina]|uniref:BAR domain-containing protein n=1 Tax=Calycina marina TaxID=1763456 RepID=A0A9P8CAV0_9HELO|nr:hypothetical protein BJ878DRAFT_299927 [Calycina marina]